MDISGQIDAARTQLTPAERRVAAVVVDDPEAVAFGTVADVARRAGASGATVMRLAARLGYGGYLELQGAVRGELTRRLRPASERIRRPPAGGGDLVSRALGCELGNVAASLEAVDARVLGEAVKLLAGGGRPRNGRPGRLFVYSGDASAGIAALAAGELSLLRPGVELVSSGQVRVARQLADAGASDVLLVLDLSRYDREVVATVTRVATAGVGVVAVSDSALSPLAAGAAAAFTVADAGTGPFDSHVGVLALANLLIAGVADRLRRHATERLDGVEAAWRTSGALVDGA